MRRKRTVGRREDEGRLYLKTEEDEEAEEGERGVTVQRREAGREKKKQGEREVPGVSNNNLYKHTLIIHIPFQCWRENPKFTEHN